MNIINSKKPFFKPKARLLLLLGNQLIKDPGIAVFELIKNAYDADSPFAKVFMSKIDNKELGKIVIEDAGTGMDYDTLTKVWLEPGTDYRTKQRELNKRTKKFQRFPLGEKGVGRFAAHKLGKIIHLVTRKKGKPEVMVKISWDEFDKHEYLDEVPVKIVKRKPEIFTGLKTGTRIEITNLRDQWNKQMVRELHRAVTSICSPPFEKFHMDEDLIGSLSIEKNSFKVQLILKEHNEWLEGLLSVHEVLEYSLFRARCKINGRNLNYQYTFEPYPAMDKVKERRENINTLIKEEEDIDLDQIDNYVGQIIIDMFIFDRTPNILELGVSDRKGLKYFLDQNGGVRVYRDGIRVYDYGEPGNDWLNLGGRRVNIPTRRISNNLVIGAVSIGLESSIRTDPDNNFGLIEKTNREGFVENATYKSFQYSVFYAVSQIEHERNKDKLRIRNAYSSRKIKEPVIETLVELREAVKKKNLLEELGPYIDRIEEDYTLIRDRYLTSASAGLSLAVVIHEIEKGIKELSKAVKTEKTSIHIKDLAIHISKSVEGFAALIRKSGTSKEKALSLIKRAVSNLKMRLDYHKIKLEISSSDFDFEVTCSRRLTVSTIMNLIDNSIWWLDNKWGDLESKKRIYIGTSKEFSYGSAIIIADNGPGFMDSPEYLIEPFISRKPDGSGLGLHLADQVMKGQGGRLEFPEKKELNLPRYCSGAIVALVFGEKRK